MYVILSIRLSQSKSEQYTYSVNEEQYQQLQIGSYVIVLMRHQLKLGVVVDFGTENNFEYELKPIITVYKSDPLNKYQRTLAMRLRNYTFAKQIDIDHLFRHTPSDTAIDINYYQGNQLITTHRTKAKDQDISKLTSEVVVNYQEQATKLTYIQANEIGEQKLTLKQQRAYEYVLEAGVVSLTKAIAKSGCSRAIFNALIDKQVLSKEKVAKRFETLFDLEWDQATKLNAYQQLAYTQIAQSLKPSLLYGVSASGKTEVYIRLIKDAVANGAQALVIVPSVMLAVQVVGKVQSHFKDVVIYHKQLSKGERYAYQAQIKSGQYKVVIATNEGLFLPFSNLQLVIYDEAHSNRYRLPAPLNISRERVCSLLASLGVKVVLATATPKISDYARAQKGVYDLSVIPTRYHHAHMPTVQFVEPSEQLLNPHLKQLIALNTTRELPTMILFNKSGYARQVMCRRCFYLHTCEHCQLPLSYNQKKNHLYCKFDGYTRKFTNVCPNCKSDDMQYIGIGIEQYATEIRNYYPDKTVEVIDSNLKSDELYTIMNQFTKGKIDILIGTRIIAFGIDFLNIDNVYVVNIDNLLTLSEVDSHEQTFQLLEQIVGRVGRKQAYSNAYIETNFKHHFVMQAVADNDYLQFYKHELKLRKNAALQPYVKICKISLAAANEQKLENVAQRFMVNLHAQKIITSQLQTPYIDWRFGKYRRYILIKYRNQQIKAIIDEQLAILKENNIDCDIDLENEQIGV